jgi:predicted kinase
MLIALSGLPGTGKTTIARLLAHRLPAVHVRVDTIEQALLRAGCPASLGHEGYVVTYDVATDNLQLGHIVIADGVNATQGSREAWQKVSEDCKVAYLPVHFLCGDAEEHRRRVSESQADIAGHMLPTWEQVSASKFDPPALGGLSIDTCDFDAEGAAELILRCVS